MNTNIQTFWNNISTTRTDLCCSPWIDLLLIFVQILVNCFANKFTDRDIFVFRNSFYLFIYSFIKSTPTKFHWNKILWPSITTSSCNIYKFSPFSLIVIYPKLFSVLPIIFLACFDYFHKRALVIKQQAFYPFPNILAWMPFRITDMTGKSNIHQISFPDIADFVCFWVFKCVNVNCIHNKHLYTLILICQLKNTKGGSGFLCHLKEAVPAA